MADRKRVTDYVMDIAILAGMAATMYFVSRNILSSLATHFADPDKEKHDQARLKAQANLQRLLKSREGEEPGSGGSGSGGDGNGGTHGRRRSGPRPEAMELNEYENIIALEVVPPEDIAVGFDDIGGLDDIIEELKESVIYPLTMPHLYSHAAPLLAAPSGVLLYGPPGCGKTMLAKALAHESGASFINLHISTLTEKWYGDSNKLVRAVFSLARKLQPAIIFIDEIDAVLGTRWSGEHEASGMVKAEFMTLWDGLTSSNAAGLPSRIVVLGATNRIHEIDEAILRRMPKKFSVPLPGVRQRRRILQLVLGETKRDPDFDVDLVAEVANGLSGSDLKEMCRDAAMMPMREYLRAHKASGKSVAQINPADIRGIRTDDFFPHVDARNHSQSQALANRRVRASRAGAAEKSSRRHRSQQSTPASAARTSTASSSHGGNENGNGNGHDVDDDNDAYEDLDEELDKQPATVVQPSV
ncbi:ATPase family aaa domain containing protein [Niveomyces insectorum RCEF 264]|uniref:ATPase family aaa domain containing protein n=1 Tax=Niveomyces insectorum RCEF 264 TaxID=1081102 RepID=A0A162MQI9_9HYPO|nr:ATPase family aaa domain containing protein [Niveomyces insectorum RCEF 264]